jgi:hypothetical protein
VRQYKVLDEKGEEIIVWADFFKPSGYSHTCVKFYRGTKKKKRIIAVFDNAKRVMEIDPTGR